jgi:hypothetical protein
MISHLSDAKKTGGLLENEVNNKIGLKCWGKSGLLRNSPFFCHRLFVLRCLQIKE